MHTNDLALRIMLSAYTTEMEKLAATYSINMHPFLLGLPNVEVATDSGDSRKIESGVGLPPDLSIGRRFTGGLPLPRGSHVWPRLGFGVFGGPKVGLSFKTSKGMAEHRQRMARKRVAEALLDEEVAKRKKD